jgi:flavodoxin I
MKILIVYDSFFGNTEKIALAIKEVLEKDPRVSEAKALRVEEADPKKLEGLSMLIVGSPTRAFRPSPAVTGFIKQIPARELAGKKVAAFDTGISGEDASPRFLRIFIRLFGYAAKPISARLVKKGASLVIAPEGFLVQDTEGPLKEGELERAAHWARKCIEKE